MKRKLAIKLLFFVLVFLAVALRTDQASAANHPAGYAKKVEVCALLTSAEIEAVQGEAVQETKPSVQPSSNFLMSQCFFRTASFNKSVSLVLFTPDPAKPSGPGPREYWQEQFHAREPAVKEKDEAAAGQAKAPKKTEEESERELRKPRPIAGLGEEAYWAGNRITGALYVLHGDAFLRISVGGIREESARIEKSKALARAALKRLW
jgi:hypothetical protein